ncbi:ATP synthase F1 subunit delta [Mycoplasma crocodyli]|uniref:ATP synthase subunit delta n=1 Tax=Mycoplasma crocodyli (strain ATCC 51981 / MP145) TaxID=512564 RepID=D5E5G2_MYCCM|nr:ATP synthase F1 subunit delta [Mycoplasma crocodyli]ADE19498.1 ATP synthase F1, delta subunit [Mycoplasma crocodyli MP145]
MYVKANPVGYAIAFYDLIKEVGDFKPIHTQVNKLKDVLVENNDLVAFLNTKSIPIKKKFEIIDEIFDDLDRRLINLVKVVTERNNALLLKHILIHYLRLSNNELNIKFARIVTAEKLQKTELQKIKKKLETLYKEKFELKNEVDEDLISGYQIHLGSEIIERNINNDLEKIKHEIIKEREGINAK